MLSCPRQLQGIFSCDEVRERSSRDDNLSYNDLEIVAITGQKRMSALVLEVTDFKYEVICIFCGCLEAKKDF